ncbi:hypothetical protein ACFLWW_01340 [Chloroflexota bacterium]
MRVPDQVRQCVVFVGLPVKMKKDQIGIEFKGTAFFVGVPSENIEGLDYVYLVTARHVAKTLEGKSFLVRINTKAGRSAVLMGEGARWWYHPTDESVDVALITFAPPPEFDYKRIQTGMFVSDKMIKNKSLGPGDEVFITGLFAQLSGSERNLPVVRTGTVAMIPDEKIPTSMGEIEAYLIEARSIGGLSGSPAFVYETTNLGSGSFHFLGLMHGHWDIPGKKRGFVEDIYSAGTINVGIAIVVPAPKILEVLNQPELVEQRLTEDKQIRKNPNR